MEGVVDRCIAESSGVALVERGATWWVVDRGTQAASTALFVLALVAGIGLVAGGVLTATVGLGGLVPMALGVLAAVGLVAVRGWKRRREAAAPEQLSTVCGFDFGRGALVDPVGRPICALAQVRLHRAFQLTSSSPALELHQPAGKLVLVRGNPFGGGIHDVEHALQQRLR